MVNLDFAWIFFLPLLAVLLAIVFWLLASNLLKLLGRIFND